MQTCSLPSQKQRDEILPGEHPLEQSPTRKVVIRNTRFRSKGYPRPHFPRLIKSDVSNVCYTDKDGPRVSLKIPMLSPGCSNRPIRSFPAARQTRVPRCGSSLQRPRVTYTNVETHPFSCDCISTRPPGCNEPGVHRLDRLAPKVRRLANYATLPIPTHSYDLDSMSPDD